MSGTALSTMPVEETYLIDDDPDLLRACNMTGSIRWLEIYRAYLYAETFAKTHPAERRDLRDRWAYAMGVTGATLDKHRRWAEAIRLDDLVAVFAEQGIGENEWTQRVGTSHLAEIGRAMDQEDGVLLTSKERAAWVRDAYHGNLGVAQLKAELRAQNLLPEEKGANLPAPSKMPTTLADLLRLMADAAEADGNPPLPCELKPGTYSVRGTMRSIADRLARTTFTMGSGEGGDSGAKDV